MDKFIIRLKQRVPINYLNFEKLQLLNEDKQNEILNTLVEIAETNGYYSMNVLKKLINVFDKDKNMEINEEYYEYLMEWLNCKPLNPTDTDVILYTLDNGLEVKIRESPNLISGLGTTGLRTWEASLYLSNYLLKEKNSDFDGDILELGCGTGIVSISMMKNIAELGDSLNYGKFYITDGDSQLIERVKDNILLNNFEFNDLIYEIRKLWWGEDSIPNTVKTIIAADVTYDSSIIPDLINVINEGMSEGSVTTALVAATKRNEETLAVWEKWLNMGQSDRIWDWEIVSIFKGCDHVIEMDISNIFYGAVPNDIFIYRLRKV